MSKKQILLDHLKEFMGDKRIKSSIEIDNDTEEYTIHVKENDIVIMLKDIDKIYIQKLEDEEKEELVIELTKTRNIIITQEGNIRVLI